MVSEYELVLQVKIFCLVIGVMEEQKVTIKFRVKAGKSAVESIELVNMAYGVSPTIRPPNDRVQSGWGKTLQNQRNFDFKNRE